MGQTFEELIGFHLNDLYSAALCFTLDELRAEELLQEASIRAFHEYRRHRRQEDFRRAMLELLVSTYLQRQRRMGRDPLAPNDAPDEEILYATVGMHFEPFPDPGTPGYRLLRDWMNHVWTRLDDGDRLVLWLADVEKFRHLAVAEMLDVDEAEVRNRHYRARLTLSQGMARELRLQGPQSTGGAEA